jgi:hypothetical protein
MKSQTIKLHSQKQIDYANKLMTQSLDEDDLWCVEIKKHKEAKTLQQLRGLFGTWYDYLSDTLGETKDDLHDFHKCGRFGEGGWLADIYITNPQGVSQQMWVELVSEYAEFDDMSKDHMARISLSWATIDQMREYMNRIEHYYMNAGYPLPILEKYQRWYR